MHQGEFPDLAFPPLSRKVSRPSQEVDVFHSVTPYSNPSAAVAGPSFSISGVTQEPHNSQRYPESVTLAFTTPVSTRPFAIAGASTTVTAPLADSTPPPAKWWDTFALLNSDSTLLKWNRTCKHCGIKVCHSLSCRILLTPF